MIGVFDSGLGGLSVLREIVPILPNESYIYIADSGFCPYGPKSKDEIISRAKTITEYLISEGTDIIVVACNTATAAAISYLRENYEIPFIGMEPAIKPAVLNSKTGVIGVLATQGTFKGDLYLNTLHKFGNYAKVIEQIGTGLVEIVENNEINSEKTSELLHKYIDPMLHQNIDNLVLGCTHYPFLIDKIKEVADISIEIINPAPYVASHLKDVWSKLSVRNNHDKFLQFYTTGSNIDVLKELSAPIILMNYYENIKYDNISL